MFPSLDSTIESPAAHLDPSLPVNERVQSLLSQMTLDEKLQQMVMEDFERLLNALNGASLDDTLKEKFGHEGIGCLTDARRLDPKASAEAVNALQRYLVEETRLGIPAFIVAECLHGHLSPGATVFPQALAMASAWNPELVQRMAAAAAREARAVGVVQALSPDLDVVREPRWGRGEETYGEDPYLTTELGMAYIRGMQGTETEIGPDNLICTVKHFAGHGSPESGLNLAPVLAGERELHSVYLPPFQAAVVEGKAGCVMTAYSELDGVPSTASRLLFTEILREAWGFEGYVISDYSSIEMLHRFHGTAASPGEAGRQAISCGVDLEAPHAYGFGPALRAMIEAGEVDVSLVDQAVSRILRMKFLSGLFEHPYVDADRAEELVFSTKHRELATELARESIILLKNDGGLLPLSPKIGSIAVVGPNADQCQFGDYTCPGERGVTPLAAIRAQVSPDTVVRYARGCDLGNDRRDGFQEAVDLVNESDAAIVIVGESSHWHNGARWGDSRDITSCGEGFDVDDLKLPGVQEEFVRAVHATGKPVVLVLAHGRTNTIEWMAHNIPAIVETWYAGEGGGTALAEILFGKVNPSGKLPVSVPRSTGQLPCYYNYKPSAKGYYDVPGSPEKPGRDYVFSSPSALYSFGHGLSYTRFSYENLRITPDVARPQDSFRVEVDVANVGECSGKEVVQLYIRDVVSSVTTPVRRLRAFRKIALAAGERAVVAFVLGKADLQLLDMDMKWTVEPGEFEVAVGPLVASFHVKD